MKKLRITIEGKSYDVLVEVIEEGLASEPLPLNTGNGAPTVAPALTTVSTPRSVVVPPGAGDVVSPISGKLVSIDVHIGDEVSTGVRLATIEAMKMFTHISATHGGRVASIKAKPGDSLDEGAVILTLL